jgi:hypothetical protein
MIQKIFSIVFVIATISMINISASAESTLMTSPNKCTYSSSNKSINNLNCENGYTECQWIQDTVKVEKQYCTKQDLNCKVKVQNPTASNQNEEKGFYKFNVKTKDWDDCSFRQSTAIGLCESKNQSTNSTTVYDLNNLDNVKATYCEKYQVLIDRYSKTIKQEPTKTTSSATSNQTSSVTPVASQLSTAGTTMTQTSSENSNLVTIRSGATNTLSLSFLLLLPLLFVIPKLFKIKSIKN